MSGGLLTPAETFAITVNAKVVLPSLPCTDSKFVYVHSSATDISRAQYAVQRSLPQAI